MNLSMISFLLVVNQNKKSFNYHAVKFVFENKKNFYFNLDHIVPLDNVLAIALPSGQKNVEFEFTAINRSNTTMVHL